MTGDPTMAGCTDPGLRIKRLRERQQHLREEISIREDQIGIMEHEIAGLKCSEAARS